MDSIFKVLDKKKRYKMDSHFLENIIAEMPGIIFWKNKDSIYQGCNNTLVTIFGVNSRQDIIGKSDFDFRWSKEEAQRIINDDKQVINTGVAKHNIYERVPLPDGLYIDVLTNKVPLYDDGDNIVGVLAVSIDITEQKKAEKLKIENEKRKAQLELQEQLAHMDRLNSMSALAVGIAHELNQPLSAINTFAGGLKRRLLALKDSNIPPEIFTAFDSISQQAQRAGKIIHELKDFLRKDSGEKTKIDINQLIQGVLTVLGYKIKEQKVDVVLKFDQTLPTIFGFKVQLEQVLINLINNAIDAINMAQNSTRKITIRTKKHGNEEIQISVADTGIGMDKARMDKLFQPFQTSKVTGMGIGLSLCLNIVEKHLGHIDAVSKLNKGTIFHVLLPTNLEK